MRPKNAKKILVFIGLLLVLFSGISREARGAEEKLTLSITPPLFQLNIGPGEFWASSLKMVNTNSYDLTLYASVMNFKASGETGAGKFTPIIEDDPELAGYSLAHWIDVSKEPIFIPKEKSVDIPFSVHIPENASPGGHYAAILVGTRPLSSDNDKSVIKVSSLVSSLIFVRIRGDVLEDGNIREFITEKTFYQEPEVTFMLRFENKGNVHLQPQGEIVIYNMWGKERGKIPINQKSNFGNVLPQSTRKFVFEWRGEQSFFEAGRYKAVTLLAYGDEASHTVHRSTYFWVVPLKPTLAVFGGLIIFFVFATFMIRVYIKKTIAAAQGEYGTINLQNEDEDGIDINFLRRNN